MRDYDEEFGIRLWQKISTAAPPSPASDEELMKATHAVSLTAAPLPAEPMQISAQDAVDSHLECVKYMTIYVKLGETILIYIYI